MAIKFHGSTIAGTTGTIMGQIHNKDGDITAENVASIILRIVERKARRTLIVAPKSITPADVIDVLKTDFPWSLNTTGYNFRDEVTPDQIPDGTKVYIFQYEFTPTSGSVFIVECTVATDPSLFDASVTLPS